MTNLGQIVREAREKRGWSQERLAKEAGTSQTTIDNIERGVTRRSRYLLDVLRALDISIDHVDASVTKPNVTNVVREPFPDTSRQLPIYASAEGGNGQMVTDFRPIDFMIAPEPLVNVTKAFGMYITGDSMEPRYYQGEVALIHPHRPPRPGDDVLLVRDEHGSSFCMIKRLRGATSQLWRLTQFNPPPGSEADFDVPRADWPQCFFVAGRLVR